MRGLTPAEHACLAEAADDLPAREVPEDDCRHEQSMIAQGRIETIIYYEDSRRVVEYRATPLGRLALRLWPATMATPGAGG